MPNLNPSPSTRFKKGQTGNPRGGSRKQRELCKIIALTNAELKEVAAVILNNNRAALFTLAEDEKASLLTHWIANLIVKSLTEGDSTFFRVLMDRILGKPKETHEINGPEGGPIGVNLSNFSHEELLARTEELRRAREAVETDADVAATEDSA